MFKRGNLIVALIKYEKLISKDCFNYSPFVKLLTLYLNKLNCFTNIKIGLIFNSALS